LYIDISIIHYSLINGHHNLTKKKLEQVNGIRRWFSEKINETDNHLARLLKKKRERTQINKITNKRKEITINIREIKL